MAGVEKLLRAGEALISYFAREDRLLVWIVRSGRPATYREISLLRADLARRVARFRSTLDQTRNLQLGAGRLAPVDVAEAQALYGLLLAPFAGDLAGVQHLIIVPDETLLPLPFGALLTRAGGPAYEQLAALAGAGGPPSPADLGAYATLPWLVKEYALTILPSATSLRLLRQVPRPAVPHTEPLIGFGDPALAGTGGQRGGGKVAVRGGAPATEDLRKLDALPGTRDELLAVAQALGANPQTSLFLGSRATKGTVRALNASGRLGRARVLAFATHALVAGEVKGLREPALVLTPPATRTEEDDGLLGLEDILSLKLSNTEWVILSACNTAAPDGTGEGLSGLVRAFFSAGARALLVSHWSVDDRGTQALMTEIFRRYAADPTLPRAEALRQGMLALLQQAQGSKAFLAHPFAWAPFFLVGDGAGRMP